MTVSSVAEKRRSPWALAARNFCLTKAGRLSLSPRDIAAILLRVIMCSEGLVSHGIRKWKQTGSMDNSPKGPT